MKKSINDKARRSRPSKRAPGRSMPATQAQALVATEASAHPLDLTPGFRDRLIASLDQAGVPPRGRMAYVASLSYRAVQTVSRWLDPNRPGLPDLESCVRLCEALGRSSDWMLGLSTKSPPAHSPTSAASAAEVAWVREAAEALHGDSSHCEVVRMVGDEMAPRIRDGDLLVVDRAADKLAGNGIYALLIDGRSMIRRVESRLGTGLVFRCENASYQDCVVKDAQAARRMGLQVLGKVVGAISVTHFRHT